MLSVDTHNHLKKYGKGISLLLVDDDVISLELYRNLLSEYFPSVDIATDGIEAFEKWSKKPVSNRYSIIITDILMPRLDGFGLIEKIRESSFGQRFIVLTSIDDLNEMREIINLGIDGILQKPFERSKFLEVAYRVSSNVYKEQLLVARTTQLAMASMDKIRLKTSIKQESESAAREPKIQKNKMPPDSFLVKKYAVRTSIAHEELGDFLNEASYLDLDKMDIFQDKMIACEVELCKTSNFASATKTKQTIMLVAYELREFAEALNLFGKFPVAANAATNLVVYLENLDASFLDETKKRDLMIDLLLLLLQDINAWIVAVFVEQIVRDIHYFDASFANSCLGIEMVFGADGKDNGDDLNNFLELF